MSNQLIAIDHDQLHRVTGGTVSVDQVRNGASKVDKLIPNEMSFNAGPLGRFTWDVPNNPANGALDFISYPQKTGSK